MLAESFILRGRRVVLPLICVAVAALPAVCETGCRRAASPNAKASAESAPAPDIPAKHLGPLDTVRRVHQCRTEGQTATIAEYLCPKQRDAVIDYVLSVDELTSAGKSLKARVNRVVGLGSAGAFDRTAVADTLGPFSRNVECVSETIDGDIATVRIRVGGRLPLEDVGLVRMDGCWLIRTDPPIPGVSAEMRKLAHVLRRVGDEVEHRKLTAEQIEHELALRQRPILERIDQLVQAANENESSTER